MKDIHTLLGEIGLTVPEDKKAAFDTAVRENYKTVSEHDKVVKARDDYKTQLDAANTTISDLEKNKGDVTALQAQIDTYKKEKEDREEAEKAAAADAALMARFDKLHGERKYTNDFTKNGVFAEFKEALGKPENEGKSDADIFTALTKDRDGIFTNPNPHVDIPGFGDDPGDKSALKMRRSPFVLHSSLCTKIISHFFNPPFNYEVQRASFGHRDARSLNQKGCQFKQLHFSPCAQSATFIPTAALFVQRKI